MMWVRDLRHLSILNGLYFSPQSMRHTLKVGVTPIGQESLFENEKLKQNE